MRESPSKELKLLVDRLLNDGGLRRSEVRRLEDLMRDDSEALGYYTELMAQEGLMAQALHGVVGAHEKPSRSPLRVTALAATVTAAAACVAVWLESRGGPDRLEPVPAAFTASDVRVTDLVAAEWEEGRSAVLPDGRLASPHVALRGGFAELTYPNGARLILEGPSDFTVGGSNSGFLAQGKLVAHVPPGAEGFAIAYERGRVVDLGTEFGLGVKEGKMELSVFDGSIELQLPDAFSRALREGQAVAHDGGVQDLLREIPINETRFVRNLPGTELPWQVDPLASGTIEFDVSRFITKASDYLVVFKWTSGMSAVSFGEVQLRLNGRTVAEDLHFGMTGTPVNVRNNTFKLNVPSEKFVHGRWTLHASVKPHHGNIADELRDDAALASGLLLVEEGFVFHATAADFIGRWSYHYNGNRYVREFHANGRASLVINGHYNQAFYDDSRWKYENGAIILWHKNHIIAERHILRDPNTLVFISNRYPDAVKIADK